MVKKRRKKKGLSKKRTVFLTMISLCVIIAMTYIFSSYFVEIYNIYK